MGYVEQRDQLIGHHTVRESLDFSAALRLPSSVSHETRAKFVDQIVEDLELTDMQNRLVGDVNIEGLSPGEMKRLTIGQSDARVDCVELTSTGISSLSCQRMLIHIFFLITTLALLLSLLLRCRACRQPDLPLPRYVQQATGSRTQLCAAQLSSQARVHPVDRAPCIDRL